MEVLKCNLVAGKTVPVAVLEQPGSRIRER
jgi:hypothetical protein